MQEMQETRVRSLDQEDPLGEEMATRSSILAWKILWTEELGGLSRAHTCSWQKPCRRLSLKEQILLRGSEQEICCQLHESLHNCLRSESSKL